MHRIQTTILSAILILTAGGGCALEMMDDEQLDEYGWYDEEDIGRSEHGVWVISAPVRTDSWSSGNTNNLSSWQEVTCAATYGANYLVTKLKGWREPSGNADNFVARLRARCTEYAEDAWGFKMEKTSTWTSELVYSGSYDGSRYGSTELANDANLPLGVRISHNLGEDYVKDVALIYGNTYTNGLSHYIHGYASPYISGWALDNGLHSYTDELLCPEQYVMAGIGVKYSTNNSKIRQMKIYCRAIAEL